MLNWSAQEWTVFLGALGAMIAAIVAGALKILGAVREIHLSINSRMDELVLETRKSSLAEGRDQMRQAIVAAGATPPTAVVQVEQIHAKTIAAEKIDVKPTPTGERDP